VKRDRDEDETPEEPKPLAPSPWERLPCEPDDSWEHFSQWIHSGPGTSIALYTRQRGLGVNRLAAYSAQWRWFARRAAYMTHLHHVRAEGASAKAREMGEQHAAVTGALLDWSLDSILDRRARGEVLTVPHALAAAKLAIDLQRLAAGAPTARIAADFAAVPEARLHEIREALLQAVVDAREPVSVLVEEAEESS